MTGDHEVTERILADNQTKWEEVFMSVSVELVEHVMQTLHWHLAQWDEEEILIARDNAEHRLALATCSTLAGLIQAHRAHGRHGGARELVLQVHDFLEGRHAAETAAERLEAVRPQRDVDPDIVDALIALAPHVQAKMARGRPGQAPPIDQTTGENHDP